MKWTEQDYLDLAEKIDYEGGLEHYFCYYTGPSAVKGSPLYTPAKAFVEAHKQLRAALEKVGAVL